MEVKKTVFKSKTFWFGIITALTPLIPQAGEFIVNNKEGIGAFWGVAAIILRFVTKDKVILKN